MKNIRFKCNIHRSFRFNNHPLTRALWRPGNLLHQHLHFVPNGLYPIQDVANNEGFQQSVPDPSIALDICL